MGKTTWEDCPSGSARFCGISTCIYFSRHLQLVADVLQIYKSLTSELVHARMKGFRVKSIFFVRVCVCAYWRLALQNRVPTTTTKKHSWVTWLGSSRIGWISLRSKNKQTDLIKCMVFVPCHLTVIESLVNIECCSECWIKLSFFICRKWLWHLGARCKQILGYQLVELQYGLGMEKVIRVRAATFLWPVARFKYSPPPSKKLVWGVN